MKVGRRMSELKDELQPLRIGYLSDSELPSSRANSVHVMKMCAALKKNGVEPVLYCNEAEDYYGDNIFEQYSIRNKFDIVFVRNKFPNKIRAISLAMEKAKRIQKDNIDIYYGRSLLALFIVKNKRPFIYESHIKPNRKIFYALEKLLLKNKNLIKLIVISNELKNEYLKLFHFLSEDDITVLHDGADKVERNYTEKDIPQTFKDNIKCNQPVIGYIGHLYPGKCMEVMIEVAQKRKNYDFHVVGGTIEWVDKWKEECEILGIENIKFYGYINNSVVNNYYAGIDIVILPFSNNIYFNSDKKDDIGKWISPLKLFEAMANGKAILASSLPSIKEVLVDGENALLADPNNIEQWCEKLDFLYENAELRKQIGDKARIDLEKKYSWDCRAKMVLSIIKTKGWK